jgi:hypothetical protein
MHFSCYNSLILSCSIFAWINRACWIDFYLTYVDTIDHFLIWMRGNCSSTTICMSSFHGSLVVIIKYLMSLLPWGWLFYVPSLLVSNSSLLCRSHCIIYIVVIRNISWNSRIIVRKLDQVFEESLMILHFFWNSFVLFLVIRIWLSIRLVVKTTYSTTSMDSWSFSFINLLVNRIDVFLNRCTLCQELSTTDHFLVIIINIYLSFFLNL